MNNNNLKTYSSQLSEKTILGIFDTDGGIEINRLITGTKQGITITVAYALGQSNPKADLVKKVSEFFEGSVAKRKTGTWFKVFHSNPIGNKVRTFLQKNKPLNPGRRKDFLLSEQVIKLMGNTRGWAKEDLITALHLAFEITAITTGVSKPTPIEDFIEAIKPSPKELESGKEKFKTLLKPIELEVEELRQDLQTMTLEPDYIIGAHFGDGSLSIGLTWKPNKKNTQRRSCTPEWDLTGGDRDYCQAFVNTMGGSVNKSGANCYKSRVSSLKNAL